MYLHFWRRPVSDSEQVRSITFKVDGNAISFFRHKSFKKKYMPVQVLLIKVLVVFFGVDLRSDLFILLLERKQNVKFVVLKSTKIVQ